MKRIGGAALAVMVGVVAALACSTDEPARQAKTTIDLEAEVRPAPLEIRSVSSEPAPTPEPAAVSPEPAPVPSERKPVAEAPKAKARASLEDYERRARAESAPAQRAAPMPMQMSIGATGVGLGGGGRAAPRMRRAIVANRPMHEGYRNYGVNPWTDPEEDRLSTFSVDVDTASYTIARRKILEGVLPPKDSVRVEEFLNYFRFDYPAPKERAFSVHMDAAPSPFSEGRHLLRVGVQGRQLRLSERRNAHLVFLVDVSGSMSSPDKLPLAKKALRLLVDNLRDGDTVSLVTYAAGVREVLPPTGLEHKARIHEAIESLYAAGSTAMASGIELAFRNASKTLSSKGNSRVIILSDGDANVGPTSQKEIHKLIARYVKEGVTTSVVGFGMGNYKDDLMEQLADKGNGNYAYVDSLMEARRIFQDHLGSTLEVIAKDVKLQVEFDPSRVKGYRLVGYENRDIADHDFRNDKVDAGEVGSGHSVTALYELELKEGSAPLATVRVRAKKPRGSVADEWTFTFDERRLAPTFEQAPADLRFATAVMGAAEIFRQSEHAAGWSLEQVERIAKAAAPAASAERQEFINLLGKARSVVSRVATR